MSDFVEDGSLAWGALLGSILGGSTLAFAQGSARFVYGILDAWVGQIEAVIEFERTLLDALLLGWISAAGGSWAEATQALHSIGPIGMVVMAAQVALFISAFVQGGRLVATY